jgi:hypothetical protein
MHPGPFGQPLGGQSWFQHEHLPLTPSEIAAHSFQMTSSAGAILAKLAVSFLQNQTDLKLSE